MLQKIIEKIATSPIVKYARKIKIINIILTKLWTWRLHSRYGKIDVAEVKDNIANIFWANDWFQHNLKYALNSTLKSIEALPKQLFDVGGGGAISSIL